MRLLQIMLVISVFSSCGSRTEEQDKPGSNPASGPAELPAPKVNATKTEYHSFYDSIGQLPEPILGLIPDGFLPLDTAVGDLNLDGIDDVLLVAKNEKEHSLHDQDDTTQFDRPLLILLRAANGKYELLRRNDKAVMCINCSGAVASDPYNDLKIKNGFFSVEHGVAEGPQHWNRIITFRYDRQKNEWYLFKDGLEAYNPLQEDEGSTVIKTKKDFGNVPFEKYKLAD